MRRTVLELVLAAAIVAAPASAADLVVTNAWITALPAHLPAGGYFTIHNGGSRDVQRLPVRQSAACGMLMLHKSSDTSGMDSMSDMDSVAVAAGATLAFAPGGYHLMCTDPKPRSSPARRSRSCCNSTTARTSR